MFDSIINVLKSMRKVFVFQNLLLLLIRVKVESAKKWTFSQMKVLMLEERLKKKKKTFEHFGNPFLYSWFDTRRRILMTAEESKDSANGDKLAANMAMATDMYKSWLMSSGETSMFLDIR
jgi:hypothetical protein